MKTKDKLASMTGSGTNDSILKGVSLRSVFSHFKKEKPNLIILKNNGITIEFGKAVLEKGILHVGDNSINAKHEKYDRYGDMWYLWEEGSSETSEWKTTVSNTGISAEKLNLAPKGTIPHAVILIFGDTVKAAIAYDKSIDKEIPRTIIVDPCGDEKTESVILAEKPKDKLNAWTSME